MEPLSAILNIGGKVIDRLFPDPTQKAAAMLELEKLHQSGELAKLAAETDLLKGQLEINKIEAANSNLFVSGWRPFIGWVCGIAFAYCFVLEQFLTFIFAAAGHPVSLPKTDFSEILPVLLGMLGLGGMRSFEKYKGVTK